MSTVLLERYDAYLSKLYNKLKTEYYGPYTCVHFGRTEKVGIHTNPTHHDPIGVYAFPKDYVLYNIKNEGFASMAYSHILTATTKADILNLDMSMNMAERLLRKMGIPPEYLEDPDTYHDSGVSEGHLFWGSIERWKHENNLSKNASWNALFRRTGYNTLFDPGRSIIHWAEPSQIVFLEPGTYKVVETFKKEGNSNIFRMFVKEFPNWIPKTTKSFGEEVLQLTHPSDGSYIRIYKNTNYFEFDVNVGGRVDKDTGERLDRKMLRFRDDDTTEMAIREVKKYLEETNPNTENKYTDSVGISNINEFSKFFKLKLDNSKRHGGNRIFKVYKEKGGSSDIKLIIFFSKDTINVSVSRYQQWSSYNYNFRYEGEYTSPKDTMNAAFRYFYEEIQDLAKKNDFDSRYIAERASETMKFLKRNVFKL